MFCMELREIQLRACSVRTSHYFLCTLALSLTLSLRVVHSILQYMYYSSPCGRVYYILCKLPVTSKYIQTCVYIVVQQVYAPHIHI